MAFAWVRRIRLAFTGCSAMGRCVVISYDINRVTLNRLGNRDDGEMIDENSYKGRNGCPERDDDSGARRTVCFDWPPLMAGVRTEKI